MKLDHVTLVSIVDDDESVRDAMKSLVRSFGYRVETFPFGSCSASTRLDCVVATLN
jgi:FixJ family two-component response regulator